MAEINTDLIVFDMPSGGKYEARDMDIEDIDMLAGEKRATKAQAFLKILEKNIIPHRHDKLYDPSSRPIADMATSQLNMRRCTLQDDFYFKLTCEDTDCEHKWWDHENLGDEKYKPKKIVYAKDGNLRTGVSKDGKYHFIVDLRKPHNGAKAVVCRLFLGKHQEKLEEIKVKYKKKSVTRVMQLRVIGIDGKYEPAAKDAKKRLQKIDPNWFKGFSSANIMAIQDKVEEFDGGIETGLSKVCPECGADLEEELPLNDKHFFSTKSTRPPSSKRSSDSVTSTTAGDQI